MSEKTKRIAAKYHELNPESIDEILTPDFVGHHPWPGGTWDRESHRRTWSEHRDIVDTIHEQVAEGGWVATRFTRSGIWKGAHRELDMMQFKRFVEDRIGELWELYNPQQLEEQEGE